MRTRLADRPRRLSLRASRKAAAVPLTDRPPERCSGTDALAALSSLGSAVAVEQRDMDSPAEARSDVRAGRSGWRERRVAESAAGNVDGDGHGVADGVADGRVAREAGELGELVVGEVAGDLEGDTDLLEAGARGLVEPEEAAQVDVALDRGLQAFEHDSAGGRVIDDRARQARGEGLEQVFARVGSVVLAEEHRRPVGVEDERLHARGVLLAGAVEALDGGAVVAAVDPVVAGTELEARQGGVGADVLDRAGEAVEVDSVEAVGDLHGELLWWGWPRRSRRGCRHRKERPLPEFFPWHRRKRGPWAWDDQADATLGR